ncbi:MAG: ABC transporter permease [Caldilineales bacterium]|nr:ABC transporter permease [Caldilineales bacterium]
MSNKRSPWLRFFIVLVYVFLYAPILVLIVYAFKSSRTNIVFEGIVNRGACGPFYWFCELFRNDEVLAAARNTLVIAFVSTLGATVIGTMAALALQRYRFPAKRFSEASLYIPIIIPELVMGIGILVLFSAVFRALNAALGLRLGMGLATVIISHIAFSVPFVILVVRARLTGFNRAIEEAARDLGATEWTTFWRVTLPNIAPGVMAGALLAFTLSLDDFVITFFTTGPGATTLPIYVYGLLRRIITPEVNALSTVWILLILLVLLLTQRLQARENG